MRAPRLVAAIGIVIAASALATTWSAAASTPAVISRFDDPAALVRNPGSIAVGPDGALWFTSGFVAGNSRIGRITTGGAITSFGDPGQIDVPHSITAGPDGAMWFTAGESGVDGAVGRIAMDGTITTSALPSPSIHPTAITTGPD